MADEIMRQLQAVRIRERSVVVSTAMDEDDRRLSGRCRHPPRTQLDRLVGGPKLDGFERGAVVPWGLDEGEPIRSGRRNAGAMRMNVATATTAEAAPITATRLRAGSAERGSCLTPRCP